MAKYNSKAKPTVNETVTHQGGTGVKFDPALEMISLLATGLDGQYYEKESEREARLITLIKEVGSKNPELVAKALIYARNTMGQRSVTHVGAVAALSSLKGNPLGTKFFTKRDKSENKGGIVRRVDDMLEIMSYYYLRNPGKPLPNAMRRGFKDALEHADAYELAKYQGKGRSVKLVDVVNLVRPKPSEKMVGTFKKLMSGELKQFNTAEDKNTKSGQIVAEKVKTGKITKEEAKIELAEAKAENWAALISNGTIGYLALLRNLRNIVQTASDETFNKALSLLTEEERIRKSLVFPHQIDIAMEVLLQDTTVPSARRNSLLNSINIAYEKSIPNLSQLFTYGNTAVVIDSSGSMDSKCRFGGNKTINSSAIEKAALIGTTLAKGIGADLYHFSTSCARITYNPLDSVNTTKSMIVRMAFNGGTSFESIFYALDKKYDRVFVISDMQGSDTILRNSSYQKYVEKYGAPYIYSIDLCGYGTSMFKQNSKLINLFGYSSDIYEMVKTAEIDPKAILAEINKIVI